MATAKEGIKQKVHGWSHHDSADLYGIDDWGNGYFRISKKGEVTVRLNDEDGGKKDVSLCFMGGILAVWNGNSIFPFEKDDGIRHDSPHGTSG